MPGPRYDLVPIGELIRRSREQDRLSRAELARITGISENSLIRYEKAGVDETGQYPPSPKLSILIAVLKLDPIHAYLGCMSEEEVKEFDENILDHFYVGHPFYEYIVDENKELAVENRRLRAIFSLLVKAGVEKLVEPKLFEAIKSQSEYREDIDEYLTEKGVLKPVVQSEPFAMENVREDYDEWASDDDDEAEVERISVAES